MGEEAHMPIEDMIKWVDSLFYLNSENLKKKGIKCKINVLNDGVLENTYKLKPQPFENIIKGILPADYSKKNFSSLIYIKGEDSFNEEAKFLADNGSVEMKTVKRNLHLDVAFMYCTKEDYWNTPVYDTYCNYTRTTDNGTHLDVFEECYCRYIQKATNDTMSDSAKNKYKVTWDDIKTNLFAVVNLTSNANVNFVGNSKQKIESSTLAPYLKETYNDMIDTYFTENSNELNEIIKIVKLTTKSRVEAQKLKSATKVERFNGLKAYELDNYIPCNNNRKGQFRELFIIEGNSAAGSARNSCDPNTQAMFLLRGVTLNAVKAKSLSEVLANKEFKALVDVLGCGIGSNFDINKLNFDRINIMTDADVDGKNISSGVVAFFFMFLRPIIEAGRLFKVLSPLYNLDDKDNPFVVSKKELIHLFQKKIVNSYKIKLPGDDNWLNKEEREEFIRNTYDYRVNLIRAAKRCGKINKYFLESVVSQLVANQKINEDNIDTVDIEDIFKDQKFITKSMSIIQKEYPEVKVDETGRYSGIVEGTYCAIKVSRRFLKKVSSLIPIYQLYGYEYKIKYKNSEEEVMRLSRFLDNSMKLMPKIIIRYKGLAELDADQLRATTMDINNRFSIQYTIEDLEKDKDIFNITHGASKSDAERRKKMMAKFKLDREELDN